MATYQANMTARPDLTQVIQQYAIQPDTYAHEMGAPVAGVENQKGLVSVVTRASMLRVTSLDRAPDGGYSRIDDQFDAMAYECRDKGKEYPLSVGEQNPPGLDLEMHAAGTLAVTVRQAAEQMFVNTLQDTEVFNDSDGNATIPDVSWATSSTATPVNDIGVAVDKVRDATGIPANTVIMSGAQMRYLLNSSQIATKIAGVVIQTPALVKQYLAGLLGVEQVIVSNAIGNTNKTPGSFTASSLWGTQYVMVCLLATPGAPLQVPSLVRTLEWTGDSNGWMADRYYEDASRQWVLRARRNIQMKVIDPAFGCLVDIASGGAS